MCTCQAPSNKVVFPSDPTSKYFYMDISIIFVTFCNSAAAPSIYTFIFFNSGSLHWPVITCTIVAFTSSRSADYLESSSLIIWIGFGFLTFSFDCFNEASYDDMCVNRRALVPAPQSADCPGASVVSQSAAARAAGRSTSEKLS